MLSSFVQRSEWHMTEEEFRVAGFDDCRMMLLSRGEVTAIRPGDAPFKVRVSMEGRLATASA